jgi:hypothetical protein
MNLSLCFSAPWRGLHHEPVTLFLRLVGGGIMNLSLCLGALTGCWWVRRAGTGGGVVQLTAKDGSVGVEPGYCSPKLPTAIGGAVLVDHYLYGTTGQAMLCVEFASGTVKREERAVGAGSLLYADGRLYLHAESGEVGLLEANQSRGGKSHATPASLGLLLGGTWSLTFPVRTDLWARCRAAVGSECGHAGF